MESNQMSSCAAWEKSVNLLVRRAKAASLSSAQLKTQTKNRILQLAAKGLIQSQAEIMKANQKDLACAKKAGLSAAMMDRLLMTPERLKMMAQGVLQVATLQDPIGKTISSWKRPNGLVIKKISVPLGVILIIFESRPNVTVECAALCIKSGNAVILRGGKEAFFTNRALVNVFKAALNQMKVPPSLVSFVDRTEHSVVDALLRKEREIDLVIPRGGESLIRKVVELSRIPVIKHYQGICHLYIDERADLRKALDIVYNAKMQRPGVCNAMETLLVHEKIASRFLPLIGEKLKKGGCELRADAKAKRWIPWAMAAQKEDFGKEYLDKILAVKTVKNIDDAINHIRQYGSAHTDGIVTQNPNAADLFAKSVDSASVMINASTRFSDGFEFGFGAEIGISTDKIHARGPMGLEGLTSYKYVVQGNGQIRG